MKMKLAIGMSLGMALAGCQGKIPQFGSGEKAANDKSVGALLTEDATDGEDLADADQEGVGEEGLAEEASEQDLAVLKVMMGLEEKQRASDIGLAVQAVMASCWTRPDGEEFLPPPPPAAFDGEDTLEEDLADETGSEDDAGLSLHRGKRGKPGGKAGHGGDRCGPPRGPKGPKGPHLGHPHLPPKDFSNFDSAACQAALEAAQSFLN